MRSYTSRSILKADTCGCGTWTRGVSSSSSSSPSPSPSREEAMDLHILDHRLRVTSISRSGLQHYTHPLIKLIFLRNRTRWGCCSLTFMTPFLCFCMIFTADDSLCGLQPSLECVHFKAACFETLLMIDQGPDSSTPDFYRICSFVETALNMFVSNLDG